MMMKKVTNSMRMIEMNTPEDMILIQNSRMLICLWGGKDTNHE